jgi:hypothetical protein
MLTVRVFVVAVIFVLMFVGVVRADGLAFSVYADQACTVAVSSVDWGSLAPGQTVTKDVYVRNEGSGSFSSFSASISGVSPSAAADWLQLSVAAAPGVLPLGPGEVAELTLTLTVSRSAEACGFSFNIVLTGFAADVSGSTGGGGGGSVSHTLSGPSKAPAAGDSLNVNGFFLVAAVAIGAFLLLGKKKR